MTLLLTDLPDDPARLPDWLEQHLVGLDLGALAAELSAVHDPAGRVSAGQLLGRHRDAVLARGLSAAPASLIPQLLRHPEALLELQQMVLAEGGVYWDRLPRPHEVDERIANGHRRLQALMGSPVVAALPPPVTPAQEPARTPFYRRPWFVCLATAAVLLIAVSLWQQFTTQRQAPAGDGWGWAQAELPKAEDPAAYLDALAGAAEEWFNKQPDEPAELALRIGEMRQGCTRLIFAQHEPLPEGDRKWLVERCRAWAGKLDEHLAALEAGGDVEAVREEMGATVRRIAGVLRERAREIRSA